MFVLIVGCGRVGSAIAHSMLAEGNEVSVLDEDPEAIALLDRRYPEGWEERGGRFTVGTALEIDALLAAGIDQADAFVASTDGDNTNLVVAQIAKRMLAEGHDVSVLDEDPEAIAQLERDETRTWQEQGGSFTVGTALEIDALVEAGIDRADAFVASTDGDNTNLVIAQVAQRRFGVDNVVVRVLDPARAAWYEQQGLKTVCPTRIAIEQLDAAVRERANL